jgi:acyl-CoA thioester hydrolase
VSVVHLHQIRVRYAETDQMGVAHHSACVAWLEEARIEWLRARGRSYRELETGGLFMPVVELSICYFKTLRFDDVATLSTTAVSPGPTRLTFTTSVLLGDQPCLEGVVTVAAVDPSGRPVRIPPELRA